MMLADELNDYLANAMAGRKRCSNCGEFKTAELFYTATPSKSTRDGRTAQCRDCLNAYARYRRTVDGDRIRALERKTRNPVKNAVKNQKWRAGNREAIAAYRKAWEKANRDKVQAYKQKARDDLSASYVRAKLKAPAGAAIPEAVIETKREQLVLSRLLKQLKGVLDESQP